MSLLAKKDVDILLKAGFSEEDLGLVDDGIQGVEIYESPNDYFARELIENACEQGLCSLMDDILPFDPLDKPQPYDTSHPGLYDGREYAGNDDPYEDVPINLRSQAEWLRTIKLGKISIWQRINDKNGFLEWPVKELRVEIPKEDQERMNKLSRENQKILWVSYARDEWKKCWGATVDSLKYHEIEHRFTIKTKKNTQLNIILISADNVRKYGYQNLPPEARWISIIYFEKD